MKPSRWIDVKTHTHTTHNTQHTTHTHTHSDHYNFFFKKKEDRLYMKSSTPEAKYAGVFQIQSLICGVNFSNNVSITQGQ